MLFARIQTLLVALSLFQWVSATNYLELEFSSQSRLEDYFECERSGNAIFKEGYANISDLSGNWQILRTSQFNYEMAACTCVASEGSQRTRLTTSQSYLIDSEDYILRWEARSGLYKVQESFYVSVIDDTFPNTEQAYSDYSLEEAKEHILLQIQGQDSRTKTYALSLKEFAGKRIRISFVATSSQGWMLLLDNIFLGEPSQAGFRAVNDTPYHCPVDKDGSISIHGTITSVGCPSTENVLELYTDNQLLASLDMGYMETGKEYPWEFKLPLPKGQSLEYSVMANGIVVASSKAIASTFSKRIFTDHFTGTWCNNCPESMLEVATLEERYGNEMIVANTHIGYNDLLTQEDYTCNFEVYAIPIFYFDHQQGPYSIKDYIPATLSQTPIAAINLSARRDDNQQKVMFHIQSIFAEDTENSTDRYRIGLMLLGDFYDPQNALLSQSNMQPLLQKGGVLHYTRDGYIPAKAQWHFDVPYNTKYGFQGVANSLPQNIIGMGDNTFEMSLDIPDYLHRYQQYTGSPLKDSALAQGYPVTAIAMIIDTQREQVINCAKVYLPLGEQGTIQAQSNFDYPGITALSTIDDDLSEGTVKYYNISGLEISNPQSPGIYIKRTPSSITKVFLR